MSRSSPPPGLRRRRLLKSTPPETPEAYGYLWWVTDVGGDPAYFAFGLGGQMIAVVPDRDLVVVLATEFDQRDIHRINKAVQPSGAIRMVEESIAPQFATAD